MILITFSTTFKFQTMACMPCMLWPLLSLNSSLVGLPFAYCAPFELVSLRLPDWAQLVSFSESLYLLFPLP